MHTKDLNFSKFCSKYDYDNLRKNTKYFLSSPRWLLAGRQTSNTKHKLGATGRLPTQHPTFLQAIVQAIALNSNQRIKEFEKFDNSRENIGLCMRYMRTHSIVCRDLCGIVARSLLMASGYGYSNLGLYYHRIVASAVLFEFSKEGI